MEETKCIASIKHGLRGEVRIPGDKSISHRSVMFSALGSTPVHISNFLHAQDCMSTVACIRALGAKVDFLGEDELIVTGNGLYGLSEPQTILDAGNSGTTLRLMMGILAGQPFLSTFTGDTSLHTRPMKRVIKPLREMGAQIYGREKNTKLPIAIVPIGKKLHGMAYNSPVASAQVKSAILLAGLFADAPTTVIEPHASRDHTEQMLRAFGVPIETNRTAVTVRPMKTLVAPRSIEVPGDISSAAYWLVAGSIIPKSDLILKGVGINPTRTGILDILHAMGARITIQNERTSGGEKAADIHVETSMLKGTEFGSEIMPRLIDEIPILAVAALFAEGDTIITGAGELRFKETDRIQAIADQFNKFAPGAIEDTENGLVIHGGKRMQRATCFSYDDHRIAMSLAVLGAAGRGVEIERPDCVNISYPTFYDTLLQVKQK